jgi:hypothetical protein
MTAALAEVRAAHSALPHEPGSAWQLRFGHITTYSAVYYRRAPELNPSLNPLAPFGVRQVTSARCRGAGIHTARRENRVLFCVSRAVVWSLAC